MIKHNKRGDGPSAYIQHIGEEKAQEIVLELINTATLNKETGCLEGKSTHTGPRGGYVRRWTALFNSVIYGHRIVCEWFHQMPDEKAITLHKCSNRQCVNPAHLSWGTHSDNQRQRREEERRRKEEDDNAHA